ncbi:MAG: PepSY domain-containing protein [Treponema sp.]|nr:PepSY domain-containing protein [Treponema sp.]
MKNIVPLFIIAVFAFGLSGQRAHGQEVISTIDAGNLAISIAGGGTVVSLDMGSVYRIVVVNGATQFNIYINARTGDVVRVSTIPFSGIVDPSLVPVTGVFGAEDPAAGMPSVSMYTFFVNAVSGEFRFPLIGLVNIAMDDHSGLHLGLLNQNMGALSGLQAGAVNVIGGNLSGVQFGIVNTTMRSAYGVQFGAINTAGGAISGGQAGVVNIAANDLNGGQAGFLNFARGSMSGLQFGLINYAGTNAAGVQLGFINFAHSVEDGLPIGFISIVRHGGYRAFELGFSEFFPRILGLRLGVERFYTTLSVASDSDTHGRHYSQNIAAGFGLGTIIPIAGPVFFNVELNHFSGITARTTDQAALGGRGRHSHHRNRREYRIPVQTMSLTPHLGLNVGRVSLVAGPSLTWRWNSGEDNAEPNFGVMRHDADNGSTVVIGARAGLRFRF